MDQTITLPPSFRYQLGKDISSCAETWGLHTPPPEELQESYFDYPASSPKRPVAAGERPYLVVVGVGYVGLHLVQSFGQFYDVAAYDISKQRLQDVKSEVSHLPRVTLTSDVRSFGDATHFLISVPTLMQDAGRLDTSYIRAALANVAMWARPNSVIVIESSVSVGMTRSLLQDMVLSCNLKAGMSPERVDPGRVEPAHEDIPKIISGLDDIAPGSLAAIQELYSPVFRNLVPVSTPEVAEMTKLYENCQRMMCIAFANEMADACVKLGLDPFEVSAAAATKPFGYLPMKPSAGVGGHCIPVNPHYLFSTSDFPLLRQATSTMASRPHKIVDHAMASLHKNNRRRQERRASVGEKPKRVLVVGLGFKKGQSVLSHSPGVAMVEHLTQNYSKDTEVMWADTLVSQEAVPCAQKLAAEHWHTLGLSWFDLIIIANKQTGFDYDILQKLRRVKVEDWSR